MSLGNITTDSTNYTALFSIIKNRVEGNNLGSIASST